MKRLAVATAALCLALGAGFVRAQRSDPPVVTAVLSTAPLFNYEDAPATSEADDPDMARGRCRPTFLDTI